VASNHTLDQGEAGIDTTLGHLDRVGVGHAGAARTAEEAATVDVHDVRGVRVAHLSATYGFNGFRRPAERPWRAELIDPPRIAEQAARARAGGADVVVVSLHWGVEHRTAPSAWQREVAAAVAATAEVDLIIGHHAHVVQPVERVGDVWVAFGLGNLLSNMVGGAEQDGVLLHVTFAEERPGGFVVESIEHLPTRVAVDDGHRIVPAPPDSWARTVNAIGPAATPLAERAPAP
jgi:poly-gamma-glutamate synthesis protein (capsule biosynthesis protein)